MKKLLVVDMQKGFINKNTENLPEKVNNLIKNGDFDQIIATKFVNFEGSQFDKFLGYKKFSGKEEREIVVNLPSDALIFEKTSYAMRTENLEKSFSANDEVYVCGVDYDACVLAICYQLFDYGIQPYVLWDYVGSHSDNPALRNEVEKIFSKNFGKNSVIKDF